MLSLWSRERSRERSRAPVREHVRHRRGDRRRERYERYGEVSVRYPLSQELKMIHLTFWSPLNHIERSVQSMVHHNAEAAAGVRNNDSDGDNRAHRPDYDPASTADQLSPISSADQLSQAFNTPIAVQYSNPAFQRPMAVEDSNPALQHPMAVQDSNPALQRVLDRNASVVSDCSIPGLPSHLDPPFMNSERFNP